MTRWIVLLRRSVATAFALGAVGCSASGTDPDPPPATRAPTSPAITQAPASPGRNDGGGSDAGVAEVLRFSAPRLGGGQVEGEDYSGRDTAFWFWAPW